MNATDGFIGAAPPPPGVEPNLTNPESVASHLILACVLGPALTVPVVALRLYTGAFILKRLHLDDCMLSSCSRNH
jgi:hypothetical protein